MMKSEIDGIELLLYLEKWGEVKKAIMYALNEKKRFEEALKKIADHDPKKDPDVRDMTDAYFRIQNIAAIAINPNLSPGGGKSVCSKCEGGLSRAHVYCGVCDETFLVPFSKRHDTFCPCGERMEHITTEKCSDCEGKE